MQVVKAAGASIINDAYNANPDSMRAALIALKEFPGAERRLAVLGLDGGNSVSTRRNCIAR